MPVEDVEIAPERVAELMRSGDVQLVDVREPREHEAGRIAGARHIEVARLADEAGSLDPAQPVYFYCRVGGRSWMAATAFRRAGIDAYSMAGGLEAWAARGLPLEPKDGYVAEH
jgi:rhodanese-related sulfurtransferase